MQTVATSDYNQNVSERILDLFDRQNNNIHSVIIHVMASLTAFGNLQLKIFESFKVTQYS